jgi:hypothetical protein
MFESLGFCPAPFLITRVSGYVIIRQVGHSRRGTRRWCAQFGAPSVEIGHWREAIMLLTTTDGSLYNAPTERRSVSAVCTPAITHPNHPGLTASDARVRRPRGSSQCAGHQNIQPPVRYELPGPVLVLARLRDRWFARLLSVCRLIVVECIQHAARTWS